MSEKQIKTKKKEKSEMKTTGKSVKSKREMTEELNESGKVDEADLEIKIPPKCYLTKSALEFDEGISLEEFCKAGDFLCLMGRAYKDCSLKFWIGDWMSYALKKFKRRRIKTDAMWALRKYSCGTLRNLRWVAELIEPSRRREKLSFGHHQVVAGDPHKEQDLWLDLAEECKFSVMELRKLRRKVYRKRHGWSDFAIHDFYRIASECKSEMNSLGNKIDRMIEFREKCDSDLCDGHIEHILFFRSSELLLTKVAIISKGTNIFKTAQEKANEKNKENKDDEKNSGFFQGGHGNGLLAEMILADWEEIPEVGAKKWIKQKRREHIDKQLARHLSESEVEAN